MRKTRMTLPVYISPKPNKWVTSGCVPYKCCAILKQRDGKRKGAVDGEGLSGIWNSIEFMSCVGIIIHPVRRNLSEWFGMVRTNISPTITISPSAASASTILQYIFCLLWFNSSLADLVLTLNQIESGKFCCIHVGSVPIWNVDAEPGWNKTPVQLGLTPAFLRLLGFFVWLGFLWVLYGGC